MSVVTAASAVAHEEQEQSHKNPLAWCNNKLLHVVSPFLKVLPFFNIADHQCTGFLVKASMLAQRLRLITLRAGRLIPMWCLRISESTIFLH